MGVDASPSPPACLSYAPSSVSSSGMGQRLHRGTGRHCGGPRTLRRTWATGRRQIPPHPLILTPSKMRTLLVGAGGGGRRYTTSSAGSLTRQDRAFGQHHDAWYDSGDGVAWSRHHRLYRRISRKIVCNMSTPQQPPRTSHALSPAFGKYAEKQRAWDRLALVRQA